MSANLTSTPRDDDEHDDIVLTVLPRPVPRSPYAGTRHNRYR